MAEEKSFGKLFVYAIILVLLFFGMIRIFINTAGNFFNLELLGFLFLLLLALIGFIGYVKVWGERVLFFVFLFYLVNLVLVWRYTDGISFLLLFLALIGFLMAVPKKVCSSCEPEVVSEEEPHSEVFDVPEVKEEASEVVVKKVAAKKPAVKHSPGKYVASNMSNVYHEPKCEWAKRIKSDRLIWFKDKREATNKKYKGHVCVK
ncbi:hypothetical protein HON71_01620 [Candidatus Woesearchaeota archaeon]|jgi:hypothetical protein|nr:hypothetical protein [Candidatus Woesearchaeota archaeon]MBT5342284.1 hypothetical protein [Candidatus Woesearchaeota archaeon]